MALTRRSFLAAVPLPFVFRSRRERMRLFRPGSVEISRNAIHAALDAEAWGRGEFLVDLGDAEHVARVVHFRGGGEDRADFFMLEGADECSFVTRYKSAMRGLIHDPSGTPFSLEGEGGRVVLAPFDRTPGFRCATDPSHARMVANDLPKGRRRAVKVAPPQGTPSVRVAQLYEENAIGTFGSLDGVKLDGRANIDGLNAALLASGVAPWEASFEAAHVGLAPFAHVDNGPENYQLLASDPRAAAIRRDAGADLIGFATEGNGDMAALPTSPEEFRPEFGFFIFSWRYARETRAVYHEIGHTVGLRHNVENDRWDSKSPWKDAHGYYDWSALFQTIMSEKQGPPRIAMFSNLVKTYKGVPAGAPLANNADMVRFGVRYVSGYRGSLA